MDKGALDTDDETDRYENGITVTGLAVENQSDNANKGTEDEEEYVVDEPKP